MFFFRKTSTTEMTSSTEVTSTLEAPETTTDKKKSKIKLYYIMYGVATVIGIVIMILTFVWLNNYLGGFSLKIVKTEFNWHPLLMVIGMVFFSSQSMLIFRTGRNISRFKLKLLHAGINTAVFILAVLGLTATFNSHNFAVPPIANLYSLHSWLGLLAFILYAFQWLVGVATFLLPWTSQKLRAAIRPYHAFCGSAIFKMSITLCISGFLEKAHFSIKTYRDFPPEGIIVNVIAVLLMGFSTLTVYLVHENKYK